MLKLMNYLRASHGRFSDKISVVQFAPAHMLLIHLNHIQRAPVYGNH